MFYWSEKKEVTSKKIALVGMKRGSGVTHIGILMSMYFREKQGANVAIIEWNKQGDFARLEEDRYGYVKDCFKIQGIDYYRYSVGNQWQNIVRMDYDYFIIDFGVEIKNNEEMIKSCEERLFIGNLERWEQEQYIFAGMQYKEYDWIFVNNFGRREIIKFLQRRLKQSVYTIGYQPIDKPLNKEAEQFFYSLT